MYRKARATAATLGMALTLTTGQALAQSGDQHALGRRIEGAWVVQKTPHDCQTGAEFPVTTPELATFFEGGVTIATAGVSAAVLSTGHGIWTFTGASGFLNRFHGLLFTPAGSVARIITVTREILLSPDGATFTADDVAQAHDLEGNLLETRCAAAVGARVD